MAHFILNAKNCVLTVVDAGITSLWVIQFLIGSLTLTLSLTFFHPTLQIVFQFRVGLLMLTSLDICSLTSRKLILD